LASQQAQQNLSKSVKGHSTQGAGQAVTPE